MMNLMQCGGGAHHPGDREAKESAEPIKITVRDYLLNAEKENPAYGLFSYILLSRKPATEKEMERYAALHAAYRLLSRTVEYEALLSDSLLKPQNINVTYWLIRADSNNSDAMVDSLESQNVSDRFFVDNYDYLHANLLLNSIKGLKTGGPFIISYHNPLASFNKVIGKSELLIIDLTRIDQGQFATVLDYFQKKVLNDPETWRSKFDWEIIRIHIYSALTIHGEPILYAAKWVGDFFDVKKAFAKP